MQPAGAFRHSGRADRHRENTCCIEARCSGQRSRFAADNGGNDLGGRLQGVETGGLQGITQLCRVGGEAGAFCIHLWN